MWTRRLPCQSSAVSTDLPSRSSRGGRQQQRAAASKTLMPAVSVCKRESLREEGPRATVHVVAARRPSGGGSAKRFAIAGAPTLRPCQARHHGVPGQLQPPPPGGHEAALGARKLERERAATSQVWGRMKSVSERATLRGRLWAYLGEWCENGPDSRVEATGRLPNIIRPATGAIVWKQTPP